LREEKSLLASASAFASASGEVGEETLFTSPSSVSTVDVVLFLSAAGAEGVDVLFLSAAGAEGVDGEGIALPFSAVAGIALAGVDKGLAWSGLATGLPLEELAADPTDGELAAEEEEDLIEEGLRTKTSLKEALGVSTSNLGSGEPSS
jgi:hypothetical protein